jgi:hypothetical protein
MRNEVGTGKAEGLLEKRPVGFSVRVREFVACVDAPLCDYAGPGAGPMHV